MARKRPTASLSVECLEARDLPSASPMLDQVAVVRNGHDWYLDSGGNGGQAEEVRHFGLQGDQYLTAEWNGDGRKDLIAVRPSNGGLVWFVDLNGDNQVDVEHRFGLAGDRAVMGDWNNDGKDDPGVVRANPLRGGLDWYLNPSRTNYANPAPRHFGLTSTQDIPVVGDWNGDGKDDLGVVRANPATGLLDWYLDTNGDPFADITRSFGLVQTGDRPVAGDWNGDGRTNLGVVRANTMTGLNDWYLDTNGDIYADQIRSFGFITDTPVPGKHPVSVAAPNPIPAPAPAPAPAPIPDPTPIPNPIPGNVNHRVDGINYNATGSPDKRVTVLVNTNNPARLEGDYKVRLYWSDNPTLSGIYQVAGERIVTLSKPSTGGTKGVWFSSSQVTARPSFARYLIAVVDPNNDTREFNEADNVSSIRLS